MESCCIGLLASSFATVLWTCSISALLHYSSDAHPYCCFFAAFCQHASFSSRFWRLPMLHNSCLVVVLESMSSDMGNRAIQPDTIWTPSA
jgi:hypothetical protein